MQQPASLRNWRVGLQDAAEAYWTLASTPAMGPGAIALMTDMVVIHEVVQLGAEEFGRITAIRMEDSFAMEQLSFASFAEATITVGGERIDEN